MRHQRRAVMILALLALLAGACADDGAPQADPLAQEGGDTTDPPASAESAEPADEPETTPEAEPETTAEPEPDEAATPSDEPETIELTFWEALERGTASIDGGDDRCVDVDEETRRCEADLTFDSISTHLGRARDESVMETTTYATACPETGEAGSSVVQRGGITSQWGDELHFKSQSGSCHAGPDYWIVTGGTGRFEAASGTMSHTTTDHPAFSGFSTGQLSVRADLWEDWLPPAPEGPPDPDVDYLDLSYFGEVFSTESTVPTDEDCGVTVFDVFACAIESQGALRGNYIGDATLVSTGTQTPLSAEACDVDGTTATPELIEESGTIVSENGDEVFFTSRTRIDPCASLGSGTAGDVTYWRVTGGTGRFEGAHGLMSGVGTPGLGFESISAGTLSVRADLWPQLAEEHAKLPTGPDIIELRYWERFLTGIQIDGDDDCDTTDPALTVCDYEFRGNLTGTHIGAASEVQSGTITSFLEETCDGSADGGLRSLREGSGIITTPWGDDLEFRNIGDSCNIEFWVLDGGTGRFDGAGGVMSGLGAFEMGDDTALLQIGTFHLRADLWDDLIPDPD